MKQSLLQAIGIIIISGVLGITVNEFRAHGIPLVEKWQEKVLNEQLTGGLPALSFKQVKEAYDRGSALFVDARDPDFYHQGHIPGAVNLPVREYELVFPVLQEELMAASRVITYCDNVTCDTSVELCEKLLFAGLDRVEIFPGGIEQWKDEGQPVVSTSELETRY
jgi:rhodanese-related sulfurtransferase